MDFSFSPYQEDIKSEVLDFAKKHLNEDIVTRDKNQFFDRKLWSKLGEIKLPGLCIPEEFGGRGLDPLTTVLALEAFGEGCEDGGLCFAVSAHMLACCVPIWLYGSSDQKQTFLPKLCDGTWIAGNAMTEPHSGSDTYDVRTTAVAYEDNYVLNGRKSYISNGPVADVLLTYALTDDEKGFFGGISAFLLSKEMSGLTLTDSVDKMGVRTCQMGEAIFKDLELSKNRVLGKTGAGAIIFNKSMEWERTCLGAIHLGAMSRVLENTIAFVKERKSGDKSIGSYQTISHELADLKVGLEASRLMLYQAAWKLGNSKMSTMEASASKLFVSEFFKKFAASIFQIYAGKAFRENHEAQRLLRDAMASTIYSGTSEVQRSVIAKMMRI